MEHPVIRLDKDIVPEVLVRVKLVAPICPILDFSFPAKVTMPFKEVAKKISERHGRTLTKIDMCVNRFHPEDLVNQEITLAEAGVTGGECLICYDFVPTTAPLLN